MTASAVGSAALSLLVIALVWDGVKYREDIPKPPYPPTPTALPTPSAEPAPIPATAIPVYAAAPLARMSAPVSIPSAAVTPISIESPIPTPLPVSARTASPRDRPFRCANARNVAHDNPNTYKYPAPSSTPAATPTVTPTYVTPTTYHTNISPRKTHSLHPPRDNSILGSRRSPDPVLLRRCGGIGGDVFHRLFRILHEFRSGRLRQERIA